jgi:hypothetical protein
MFTSARALTGFVGFFALSTACASGVVTKTVGGEKFCVPESRFSNFDVPYIPGSLPDDGFGFELSVELMRSKLAFVPQTDIRGTEMPLIGSVSSRSVPKLSADSHSRKVAASRSAIVESVGNQFVAVFESAERQHWAIWQPAQGAPLTRSSINDAATLVASCAARGTGGKVCNRVMSDAGYTVSYYFDYANTSQLRALDQAVRSEVRTWRCTHGA